ncbi:MAG: SAM-dependent methyltransferase [Candidatus Ornithomonoglobus sp.]
MDLSKNGRLLYALRKSKGMTQKQVADKLNICAKTVSKWETGHGFPDVSAVSALAEILGVSSDTILSGSLIQNTEDVGNMKRTKFYVCPHCGAVMQGIGECNVVCCGKQLIALKAAQADEEHAIKVSEAENDYFITFNHEMTKEHFISFIAYVTFDKILMMKLYPEQDSSARFPKMYGGRLYYYCNKHGLFEYEPKKARKNHLGAQTDFSSPLLKLSAAAFCRDSLMTAAATGTQQCVILGESHDAFAYRSEFKSLRIFELDSAEAIADKKRQLQAKELEIPDNMELIAADLSGEAIRDALSRSGFDSGKKTLFSCLGLLYHMTENEISALFEGIASFAADGSAVVFDFADNHLPASERRSITAKSCFSYGELEMLLERHGFLIYEFLNDKDIQSRYLSKYGGGQTAAAHINYALAVKL